MVVEHFDEEYWEDRYRSHATAHTAPPTPQLIAEVGELEPGTALEAGCGEGADAVWLASRGWRVTAVDIAATALRRARERAGVLDAAAASRIDWLRADLTAERVGEERFDLVSACYVHPATPRETLFRRLADAVAPGGTLLVVDHHASDPDGATSDAPEIHLTAEEAAAHLDPGRWEIIVAEARTRSAVRAGGHEITMHDSVLRARKPTSYDVQR